MIFLPVNGPKARNEGVNEREEDINPAPGEIAVVDRGRGLGQANRRAVQETADGSK